VFTIAFASGKGGTGKTTISTNLAWLCAERLATQYVDCDVDAPNGRLFLKPKIRQAITVYRPVPDIDESACTHCGVCGEFCRFHALAVLSSRVLVFPELCHGCGGCVKVCDARAVLEREHPIGTIEFGESGRLAFAEGRLAVGETASVRLIRELRRRARPHEMTILDAPPGTSCPVVAAIRGAHAAVLVAEPTPFGLHDLRLAVEMTRQLEIPVGVVINRDGVGEERLAEYCAAERVPIWGRIAEDRLVAESYARGELACQVVPAFRRRLEQLAASLVREVAA